MTQSLARPVELFYLHTPRHPLPLRPSPQTLTLTGMMLEGRDVKKRSHPSQGTKIEQELWQLLQILHLISEKGTSLLHPLTLLMVRTGLMQCSLNSIVLT